MEQNIKANLLMEKEKERVIISGMTINIIKGIGKKENKMVMDIITIKEEVLLVFGKKEK